MHPFPRPAPPRRAAVVVTLLAGLAGLWLGACAPPGPREEACRLLPADAVAEAVGRPVVPRSAEAGTCAWYPAADSTAPSLLLVQHLTSERLRARGRYPDARTFFDVSAGLAGSAFGSAPEPVAGLGEAAVWGGGEGRSGGGELWALQGEAVVGLLSSELGRPAMEALARHALERLPAPSP